MMMITPEEDFDDHAILCMLQCSILPLHDGIHQFFHNSAARVSSRFHTNTHTHTLPAPATFSALHACVYIKPGGGGGGGSSSGGNEATRRKRHYAPLFLLHPHQASRITRLFAFLWCAFLVRSRFFLCLCVCVCVYRLVFLILGAPLHLMACSSCPYPLRHYPAIKTKKEK